MHTALNILDAEQARYRELTAALASVPAIEPPLSPLDRIPHLDADAHHRAVCNDLAGRFDRLFSDVSVAAGAIAALVALGGSARVVLQFVGGIL